MLRNHKTGDKMRMSLNFDNNNLVLKFPRENVHTSNQVSIYEYLNNFAALYHKGISLANSGKSGEAHCDT